MTDTPLIDNAHTETKKPSKLKKTLFSLALGGLAGFAGAFGFMELAESGMIGSLGKSREVAGLVGITYIIIAFAVLAGVLAPKTGATFLNVEDAEELREQKFMLGMSGLGMVTSGAALIVAALAAPVGPISQALALAAFAALMILAVIASRASSQRQDELMRAIGKETGAMGFYLMFFVGGGWALAGHLGYVAGPAPLDWLSMFWGLGLLGAFVVIAKRGMMEMR